MYAGEGALVGLAWRYEWKLGDSTARTQYHPETRVVGTKPVGVPVVMPLEAARLVVEVMVLDLVIVVVLKGWLGNVLLMLVEILVVVGFVEAEVLVVAGAAPG
jgi:hypothetical protein